MKIRIPCQMKAEHRELVLDDNNYFWRFCDSAFHEEDKGKGRTHINKQANQRLHSEEYLSIEEANHKTVSSFAFSHLVARIWGGRGERTTRNFEHCETREQLNLFSGDEKARGFVMN